MINVAFCFDKNRYMSATVAIASLLSSSVGVNIHYQIYCVVHPEFFDNYKDAQSEMIDVVQKLDNKSRITFIRFNYKNASIDYDKCQAEYGGICYYKLDLHRLLPNVDKIITLDDDMVVLRPLDGIYSQDISGNYLMVFNADGKIFHDETDKRRELDYVRLNAGVLLHNLEEIRKSSIDNKYNDLLDDKNLFYEQGLFAFAFYKKILIYDGPQSFNHRIYFDMDKREGAEIGIIHYNYGKPWRPKSELPEYIERKEYIAEFEKYQNTFFEYAKKTPYYEELLKQSGL